MVIIDIDCRKKGWVAESVDEEDRKDLLMELFVQEKYRLRIENEELTWFE